MAFFTIPTRQALPWYNFKVDLSGLRYTLELRYNVRMTRWILNVTNASNQPILMGLPMLIARDLTGQYTTYAIPPGTLFCFDNTGALAQATLASFFSSHAFYYDDVSR